MKLYHQNSNHRGRYSIGLTMRLTYIYKTFENLLVKIDNDK